MNEALRQELLALRAADEERREELVREGTLWDGYHPRMQEVHDRNAARLQEIIAEHGWPTRDKAGDDGLPTPWTIADPEHVNKRRAALGLDTIEERTALHRQQAAKEIRPKNLAEYRRGAEEWLRKAGWRK